METRFPVTLRLIMNALFIGGTGNISRSVSRLALERGIDLTVLNRGRREGDLPGADIVTADLHDETATARALEGRTFDVVANFIAFRPEDIERDLRLFAGRCGHYFFISSASAYAKPPAHPVITESTPLRNPFWEYSRLKIACEERLMHAWREDGFPVTILRPSHTYATIIPVTVIPGGEFTVIDRFRSGRPVIIHGDGTSLWTLTHSDDFAKGLVGLMGNPRTHGEAFHITSDESLTWNQIYETVGDAAGGRSPFVHIPSDFLARLDPRLEGSLLGDKAHSVIFDNTKLKEFVPDFRATVPFREGIRKTIAWFEAKPERCQPNEATHRRLDAILERYLPLLDSLEPIEPTP